VQFDRLSFFNCGTYKELLSFCSESSKRRPAVPALLHDNQLRAAARAIYETVYPCEEWTPVNFEEAERYGTIHYRNAVAAAQNARTQLRNDAAGQMVLI
jgi:hypothetical protein